MFEKDKKLLPIIRNADNDKKEISFIDKSDIITPEFRPALTFKLKNIEEQQARNKLKRFDLTSADNKEIGFDFQYLCFISKLLGLKRGQQIAYELKDDICIETADKELILIQVKHSIQQKAQDEIINLTELDIDLWKTIANWVKVITDKNDGRTELKEQKEFLKKTSFMLLTNKNLLENPVIKKIKDLKNNNITENDFVNYIEDLKGKTKNEQIEGYIKELCSLEISIFNEFIKRIITETVKLNIITGLKEQIRQDYMIGENRVNDVYNDLFAELKIDFFNKVPKGQKQVITKEEFVNKYSQIFENNRTTLLKYRDFNPEIPEKLEEQYFIKELIEINAIDVDDFVEMADYTDSMLNMKMNLEKWHEDGEITVAEVLGFHDEAIAFWKNNHKKNHIATIAETDNINALKCLCEIREKVLKVKQVELAIKPCNGEFYHLANKKRIGWKKNWQKSN